MVEDVCGGLRSLISLTFFASLFALVCRVRGWWRLVLLLMAVPVAIASNVVRIASLSLVADRWGVEAAGEESWFHAFSGVAVFAVALAFLFLLEQAIVWLGRVLHRRWTDSRLLGYLDHIPRASRGAVRIWRPASMLALVGAAVLSVVLARTPAEGRPGWRAADVAPRSLALADGSRWEAQTPDLKLTQREMEILEYPIYLYRQFRSAGSDQPVDVLIVFSANNRKAVHPPDICIKGSGFTVVQKNLRWVPLPGHAPIPMRELLAEQGGGGALFLYVYKCGDRYTPDFFWQQAIVFWNGLAGHFYGSDPAGALIRITVPLGGADPRQARDLALAMAGVLMPQIDRELNAGLHPAP
jgi:EpsI family protein